jgi:hypothetical protein
MCRVFTAHPGLAPSPNVRPTPAHPPAQVCRIVRGEETLSFDAPERTGSGASDSEDAAAARFEVAADVYKRWGSEGLMPFFAKGIINVGYRTVDKDFIYKVSKWIGSSNATLVAAAFADK